MTAVHFKVSSCSSIQLPRYLIEAERRWLAKLYCQTKLGLIWLLCMSSMVKEIIQVQAVYQLSALRFSMHMAWHQYYLVTSWDLAWLGLICLRQLFSGYNSTLSVSQLGCYLRKWGRPVVSRSHQRKARCWINDLSWALSHHLHWSCSYWHLCHRRILYYLWLTVAPWAVLN